jgi:hypothetical protein
LLFKRKQIKADDSYDDTFDVSSLYTSDRFSSDLDDFYVDQFQRFPEDDVFADEPTDQSIRLMQKPEMFQKKNTYWFISPTKFKSSITHTQ